MQKKMNLDNGNILLLNINPGHCCNTVTISEGYIQNNNLEKEIELSIWDDISFRVYTNDISQNQIDFVFDINHPLYFCIKKLLGNEEELIIDDDHNSKYLEKYLMIKKEKNVFKFLFINNSSKKFLNHEKFGVFIKNIGPDPRSKILDFSIKKRIVAFFRECEKILLEDVHQISFDEYMEYKSHNNNCDVKIKSLKPNLKV